MLALDVGRQPEDQVPHGSDEQARLGSEEPPQLAGREDQRRSDVVAGLERPHRDIADGRVDDVVGPDQGRSIVEVDEGARRHVGER